MNYCPFCQLPMDRPANQCPSCNADLSDYQQTGLRGEAHQETADDLAAHVPTRKRRKITESTDDAIPQMNARKEKSVAGRKAGSGASSQVRWSAAGASEDSALPFRPVNRPPTLILCALDDGSRDEGEWHRVRKSEFRIGRTLGDPEAPNDLELPNDNGISGRHLAITLRVESGRYRYFLTDLGSRNGTFVRVSRAALKAEQELLLGARRYLFQTGSLAGNAPPAQTLPRLVEMAARGHGNEFPLMEGDNILGTDADRCDITITGDPFVSSTHAQIFKDRKSRWVIENLNSLNGIWLRIEEMALDTGGEFQIGEQRFLVRIP